MHDARKTKSIGCITMTRNRIYYIIEIGGRPTLQQKIRNGRSETTVKLPLWKVRIKHRYVVLLEMARHLMLALMWPNA